MFKEEKRRRLFMKGIPREDWDKAVWWNVDHAFSKPVTMSEDTADYVPTQIIVEWFKVNCFDGLAYRSAFGRGKNLVLFDMDSADLINCRLYEIREVHLDAHEASNPYFVSKHYPKSGGDGSITPGQVADGDSEV